MANAEFFPRRNSPGMTLYFLKINTPCRDPPRGNVLPPLQKNSAIDK